MPRRLAITGRHRVEVLEYEDRPLDPHEAFLRMTIASGKHGTTTAGFHGINGIGQRFDQEMRLFVEKEPSPATSPAQPRGTGTTGVGYSLYVGHEFTPKGDRIEALHQTFAVCNQG